MAIHFINGRIVSGSGLHIINGRIIELPSAGGGGSSAYSITGNITATATPAAVLDYQQHPSFIGDVTTTSTPAAVMSFTRNHAIAGDVSVVLTPSAVMSYTPDSSASYSIAGDVSVILTPSAGLDHQIHPSITGSVTISLLPSAGFNTFEILDTSVSMRSESVINYYRGESLYNAIR